MTLKPGDRWTVRGPGLVFSREEDGTTSEIRADLKRLKRDSDSGERPDPAPAAAPPARKSRAWKITAAVAVVALVAGGVFLLYSRLTHKLTANDKLVLAEFANTTGDSVFDVTLRQGLSAQLEQSPFLSLVSDTRIAQTLAL